MLVQGNHVRLDGAEISCEEVLQRGDLVRLHLEVPVELLLGESGIVCRGQEFEKSTTMGTCRHCRRLSQLIKILEGQQAMAG